MLRSFLVAGALGVAMVATGCGDDGGNAKPGTADASKTGSGDGMTVDNDGMTTTGDSGMTTGNGDGMTTTGDDGMTVDNDGMTTGDGGMTTTGDGGMTTTGDGGACTGATQCSNCIDDDGDGKTDGFDPECTSAEDNDEGSFATGISGDNIDPVKQDCFFDGDSGSGQHKCDLHVCCLLDDPDTTEHECPGDLMPDKYDPDQCTVPQSCIDFCRPQTPPGCDCFGCCTVCNDAGECKDIRLEAGCDINDFDTCTACNKLDACSTSCDPEGDDCILCPGESEEDLPDSCNDTNTCPEGQAVCDADTPCPSGQFCATGCCVAISPE
ncbi:MAG TPA: hypothetical protein VFG83_02380 [Kofleriaceae bacterium]|nr:hypothetical protein [Kofleriaceae bacterium]